MNALAAFRVSGNPVTVGQAADIGSFAVDVLTGVTYFKYGAGNTEWVRAGYPLRPLKTQTTSGVSLGTNETTLHTFDLPAGLFNNARVGDHIDVEYSLITAANANLKQAKLYFGSSVLYDSGSAAVNGSQVVICGRVYQTSIANDQRGHALQNGNALWAAAAVNTALAQTASGVITVKLTGTGVADNDLVCRSSAIRFSPGNSLGA